MKTDLTEIQNSNVKFAVELGFCQVLESHLSKETWNNFFIYTWNIWLYYR